MIWKKLTICLSLCLSFFCSLFVSSSVFALEDIVTAIDGATYVEICSSQSEFRNDWCGYSHLRFEPSTNALLTCRSFDSNGNQLDQIQFPSSDFYIIGSTPNRWSSGTVSLKCRASSGRTGSYIVTNSPFPQPTGTLNITENGTYDVSSYATAEVNVENEVIYGDYHNDLVAINNSILICAAVCLVIYFFYCIYRMIIRSVK